VSQACSEPSPDPKPKAAPDPDPDPQQRPVHAASSGTSQAPSVVVLYSRGNRIQAATPYNPKLGKLVNRLLLLKGCGTMAIMTIFGVAIMFLFFGGVAFFGGLNFVIWGGGRKFVIFLSE